MIFHVNHLLADDSNEIFIFLLKKVMKFEIVICSRRIIFCYIFLEFFVTVKSEIQWTSFFFFKISLMISIWTEILHMHIIYHRLIYNCMFGRLRLENKSGISCKIK